MSWEPIPPDGLPVTGRRLAADLRDWFGDDIATMHPTRLGMLVRDLIIDNPPKERP